MANGETARIEATQPTYMWFDGEFTGLSAQKDLVLEVAAVVTDARLTILSEYTTHVSQEEQQVLTLMNQDEWWPSRPQHAKDMLIGVTTHGKNIQAVDKDLSLLCQGFPDDASIYLAGNSIDTDRRFIERDFPNFHRRLDHRIIDVSSVKILAASMAGVRFDKKEEHRALSDIHESIAELEYLLRKIGAPGVVAFLDGNA